ncbi:MAG: hypothetical protein ACOZBW_10540 [Thermodesulfobacteriota bacterium]
MKRYQIASAVACGLAVFVFALTWLFSGADNSMKPAAAPGPAVERAAMEGPDVMEPADLDGQRIFEDPGTGEDFDPGLHQQMVVARLQEMFSQIISHPRIQLQAIEKLVRYLKEVYPDSWQDHVFEYLSAAFPEHAARLYDRHLKFSAFKEWIAANYTMLIGMEAGQRSALLWDKRRQFFGKDADTIWELEQKAEQVALSLEEINRQAELPFNEKVSSYAITLDDIYGRQAEAYKRLHQQKTMDRFLALESVQADLRQMSAEERKAGLELFRTAMGLDDEALGRWAELDEDRDRRWEKGLAYMQARQQINVPGGDHETALDRLRQEYFGAEAEIIKQEESAGLFRFNQQRVYGKN